MRGVSFEFRGHHDSARWRGTWSRMLTAGSVLAPLLLGLGLGDLLAGLPIDSDQEFTGSLASLVTPYGLLFGVTLLALCLLHGSSFLALKGAGAVHSRAHRFARTWRWVALVLTVATAIGTYASSGRSAMTVALLVVSVLAAGAAVAAIGAAREGWAFTATAAAIGGTVVALFAALYPTVMVSSTDVANNLTVDSVASSSYALQVMSVVAAIFFPLILLYQGWSYFVFRRRIGAPAAGPADRPTPHNEGATT